MCGKPPSHRLAQQVWEELECLSERPGTSVQATAETRRHRIPAARVADCRHCTRQDGQLRRYCARCGLRRAVGTACGANPLPLVVPCHRVVGKTRLGGFNGPKTNLTLDVKRWLLRHEGHPNLNWTRFATACCCRMGSAANTAGIVSTRPAAVRWLAAPEHGLTSLLQAKQRVTSPPISLIASACRPRLRHRHVCYLRSSVLPPSAVAGNAANRPTFADRRPRN